MMDWQERAERDARAVAMGLWFVAGLLCGALIAAVVVGPVW